MPEQESPDSEKRLRKFESQLQEADQIVQKALSNSSSPAKPDLDFAIVGIDGRGRFVKRFKAIAEKVRPKEYQHPEFAFVYEHVRGEGTRIHHSQIDDHPNMTIRVHAYEELLSYLQKRGYAQDGEVQSVKKYPR